MHRWGDVWDAGRGRQVLALPPPKPTQRISLLPHSTPLHKLKADNMLPLQLLTPFQVPIHTFPRPSTASSLHSPISKPGSPALVAQLQYAYLLLASDPHVVPYSDMERHVPALMIKDLHYETGRRRDVLHCPVASTHQLSKVTQHDTAPHITPQHRAFSCHNPSAPACLSRKFE